MPKCQSVGSVARSFREREHEGVCERQCEGEGERV